MRSASSHDAFRARVQHAIFGHAGAVGFFALTAFYLTYPLLWHLDTHIPGGGPGDNVTFLWNAWWFREWAEGRGSHLFFTDRLFAPYGTQLILHTHTVLPSALAFALPMGSVITQHNVVLIAGLAANGIATYCLAFWHVQRIGPSVVAGLFFGTSAYLSTHLLGHFNLVHAWVLPAAVLAWLRFAASPGFGRGAVLAVSLAAATYTDYYYVVYIFLLIGVWVLRECVRVTLAWRLRPVDWLFRTSVVVAFILTALIVSIVVFGDLSFAVLDHRISIHSVRNPVTALYFLFLLTSVYTLRPKLGVAFKPVQVERRWLYGVGATLAILIVLVLPVAIAAIQLILHGDYVGQRIYWKSSPPGVDLLTMVTGHPGHAFTGRTTNSLLEHLGIDTLEQVAWLGIATPIVVWYGRYARATSPLWSFWIIVGAVFMVLAAGPFLRLGGTDTGLVLPWAGLRYLFPFSSARMPGRAIIVVTLALAMLLAYALRSLGSRRWLLAAVIALEMFPAPAPLYELPRPDAVDEHLRRSTAPGAVAELPTGTRDGFGEKGHLDHRALVHQLHHGRPLVGGFVARLSPSIVQAYDADRQIMAFIESSAGDIGAFRDLSGNGLERVPLVVLNADAFPDPLVVQTALQNAGYSLIQSAGLRELYALRSSPFASVHDQVR